MNQLDLGFEQPIEPQVTVPPGATYLREYLSSGEADELLHSLDQEEWITDLKRRVQHYGYRYDYKARRVNVNDRLGPLPEWCSELAERLGKDFYDGLSPDQMIVNEYVGAQGIAPHVDCEPCFADGIVTISLLEPCRMDFCHKQDQTKLSIVLEPGSLMIMTGDSRYEWTHGIRPNKTTVLDNGAKVARARRISLTFRRVILSE